MTVREAIKLLESNGFTFLRQRGSHRLYGKGKLRITVVYHGNAKEELKRETINSLKKLINDTSNSSSR